MPPPGQSLEASAHALAERLASARRVVVVTGAGMSRASGIPTFREAADAFWENEDPAQLATPEAYEADPVKVTRWYDARRLAVLGVAPNAGHTALARLESAVRQRGGVFDLFTQNIDGLHQRAGAVGVWELHGSLFVWRDTATQEVFVYDEPRPMGAYPPVSLSGHPMRPAVVWFGELLPQPVLEHAAAALPEADVFMSIGTSGTVYPVAGFVQSAGLAFKVEVNPEPTAISGAFDLSLRGRSDEVLPMLWEAWERATAG